MDIQLLLRLDRMALPRELTLQADISGAKRLANEGLIEVLHKMRSINFKVGLHALLVPVITEKGKLAIALALACPPDNSFADSASQMRRPPPIT